MSSCRRGKDACTETFLVCHLRHPEAPQVRISLRIEHSGRTITVWDPAQTVSIEAPPQLLLTVFTTVCRVLDFQVPARKEHYKSHLRAPKIMELLVLLELVNKHSPPSEEDRDLTNDHNDRSVCPAALMYASLERLSDAESRDVLAAKGATPRSLFNDKSASDFYENKVSTVVDGFPSARDELQRKEDERPCRVLQSSGSVDLEEAYTTLGLSSETKAAVYAATRAEIKELRELREPKECTAQLEEHVAQLEERVAQMEEQVAQWQ
ncbi:hypothetical protein C8R47DRAFT_1083045 [Mycena vitilis]|nr:hypothetical protein C8R47DRAFT_1083045 [Mycena vitilis]